MDIAAPNDLIKAQRRTVRKASMELLLVCHRSTWICVPGSKPLLRRCVMSWRRLSTSQSGSLETCSSQRRMPPPFLEEVWPKIGLFGRSSMLKIG